MAQVYRKEWLLQGLDCAVCADKIEKSVASLEGVSMASVDFTTKRLVMEAAQKHPLEKAAGEAAKIIKKMDAGIKIVDGEQAPDEDGPASRLQYAAYGASLLLFAAGLFVQTPWLRLGIFLASYLLAGSEVLLRALKNILRGQVFDENFLMVLATAGAFLIGEYPEGAAVMLFYQAGEFFQSLAVNRSRRSISTLMDIRPDYANLKTGEEIRRVSPREVRPGDSILIKPGEKIPMDGVVTEGFSTVDTSALTGESMPREAAPGAEVLSGTINLAGVLTVQVTKEFGESTVSKILELVQNAGRKKAAAENFITKFARWYTPAVVALAAILAFVPPLTVPGASLAQWVNRALVFLVVSCPCALVISIPLGFFGGIGGASRKGILIKGSNFLEALHQVDTVVFDKTGTLTKGTFQVAKIQPANGFSKEELLEYAAFGESYSSHPIARSVITAYGKEPDKNALEQYEEVAGRGIKAQLAGKHLLVGSPRLLEQEGVAYPTGTGVQETDSAVYVAVDGKYAGYLGIADTLKEDAAAAIAGLRALGVPRLVMLTGDGKKAGEEAGRQLGLDAVFAELLPQQKVEKLEELAGDKATDGRVLFVGDGINDAPVLTRADVGVAMGGLGSDAAIEAADVVIMGDEPSKLVTAIQIARKTRKIVWQNIFFALGVKAVVLVLGAGGIATMWEAVFADVGVALLAIFNSMRAMKQ